MNRLMATVAKQDVSLGEVAAIIEQDTVLVGNILRLVNSAAFGRRSTVNNVRHAVSLLGVSKVRNAAMSISVGRLWSNLDLHPRWSPKEFHLHVTSVAVLADQMGLELPVPYPEGAFTSGLLSGVGLLLIATTLGRDYTRLNQAHLSQESASLEDCEMEIFGFLHRELSASVMEHWQLPAPMSDAVRNSAIEHSVSLGPVESSSLIRLAAAAAAQTGNPIQRWVRAPAGEPLETFERAGLSAARADFVLKAFHIQMLALLPFTN
jgi:HD-like signal output (HDOD) protein